MKIASRALRELQNPFFTRAKLATSCRVASLRSGKPGPPEQRPTSHKPHFTLAHLFTSPQVKKPGRAFSKERLKRDWLEIGLIKYSLMAIAVAFPVAIRTYILSLVCVAYDDGEGGEKLHVMVADASVVCTDTWSLRELYGAIRVVGVLSLVVLTPLIIAVSYAQLLGARKILETRSRRKVSGAIL